MPCYSLGHRDDGKHFVNIDLYDSSARARSLAHDTRIGVGFGHASITRDGVPVFEEDGHEYDALPTVADAERMARAEPHCDWRIHLVSLLDERHYRRDGEGRWTLYKRGYGLS